MSEIYTVIVVILGILAVSGLFVGVSNDAVNFLNSAIGSKAAPMKTILLVASIGILLGTVTSSGMMEVARSGVFYPGQFSFQEIMMLFLGMMLGNVLLLDEPTKGLDAYAKLQLANMLKSLCKEGAAILAVTHDVDFAAQYADECAMMFDGGIISRGEPHEFFGGNRFYTTDANRIAGDIAPGCITSGEVASQCKKLLQ